MKEVKNFWEMVFVGAKGGTAKCKAKSFAFMKNTLVFHNPNPPIYFLKSACERCIFVSFVHCMKLFSGVILLMAEVNSFIIDLH